MLKAVLATVEPADAWIADRNFCTLDFTCQIALQGAFFIIREHKKYPWEALGKEKQIGKVETGTVYEQPIVVHDHSGQEHRFRRIRIRLHKKTRDGDADICMIANLSKRSANAKTIADLYRGRWTIETAFQHLATHLNSEINTLGYPQAALFGFCVALLAYIHRLVRRQGRAGGHPRGRDDRQTSIRLLSGRRDIGDLSRHDDRRRA